MNKSLLTNLIAAVVTISGYLLSTNYGYGNIIFMTGVFALSGSLTNWVAVHMLFEKVPFLYGSGIVALRFKEIKLGIKQLLIKEFFNPDYLHNVLEKEHLDASSIEEKIDFDKVFNQLTEAILQSSLSGMLTMVGGAKALEPIKQPVIDKLKLIVEDLLNSKDKVNLAQILTNKAENIINKRLAELTAQEIKLIIQKMIKQHLGWLVIWGGVFGGLIGLITSLLKIL